MQLIVLLSIVVTCVAVIVAIVRRPTVQCIFCNKCFAATCHEICDDCYYLWEACGEIEGVFEDEL